MKTLKSMKLVVLALLVPIFATGCAGFTKSVDEQGNEQTSNKLWGTLIGMGGAVFEGKHSRRDSSSIAKRMLGAGALGAGVGHLFDKQNEELAEEFRKKQIQVQVQGELVKATVQVHFTSGSTQISARDMGKINEVSQIANQHAPNYTIAIVGHTDSQGPEQMNMNLSVNRAKSVGFELAQRVRNRIQTGGFGEERPVADNSTAAGRAANRRVEFFFRPPAQQQK